MGRTLFIVLVCLGVGACSRSATYYISEGNKLFEAGKTDEAVLNYSKAAQKDPNNGEALYRLGLVELKRQRPTDALAAFSRAVDLSPRHTEARVQLADLSLAAYTQDQQRSQALYDRVVKLTEELLHENPGSFDALRLKGDLAFLSRRADEAAQFYSRANAVRPDQGNLIATWFDALRLSGHSKEAEELGTAFLARVKTSGPVYDRLYAMYLRDNRLADAERVLKAKAANNPQNQDYVLELAAHYRRLRKLPEMESALSRLTSDRQTFTQGRLAVGSFFAVFQEWNRALAEFDAGAAEGGADSLTYKRNGIRVLALQGQTDAALKRSEETIKSHPEDPELGALRASLLAGDPRKLDEAVSIFKTLVAKQPNDATLRVLYARALLMKRDLSASETHLRQAVKTQPSLVVAYTLLADVTLQQHRPAEALQYADMALEIAPRDLAGRVFRAAALADSGRSAEAAPLLTQLGKEYPGSPDVLVQTGVFYLRMGEHAKAEAQLRKALQIVPYDVRTAEALARCLIAQKRNPEALSVLRAQIQQRPESAELRALAAGAAIPAQNYDMAVEQYREALRLSPGSAVFLLGLADALRLKGEAQEAFKVLGEARTAAGKDINLLLAMSSLWSTLGRPGEAAATVKQALAIDPENPAVMNNVAFILADAGQDLEGALTLAKQAVAKMPQRAEFADTLGWVYLKNKMIDPAVEIFSRLVHEYPARGSYAYHLGAALLAKGDKSRARSQLERALRLATPQDEQAAIRVLLARL